MNDVTMNTRHAGFLDLPSGGNAISLRNLTLDLIHLEREAAFLNCGGGVNSVNISAATLNSTLIKTDGVFFKLADVKDVHLEHFDLSDLKMHSADRYGNYFFLISG